MAHKTGMRTHQALEIESNVTDRKTKRIYIRFALSLLAFLAFCWVLCGTELTLGFTLLVLVHEMGHYFEAKRQGFNPDLPVFLPGLGAYVRWSATDAKAETRAAVAIAGPIAGLAGSLICAFIWKRTGSAIWAVLAGFGALMNIANLIPYWFLDGAQAAAALNKPQRALIATAAFGFYHLTEQKTFLVLGIAALLFLGAPSPRRSSYLVAFYFIFLLIAFGLLINSLPMQPALVKPVFPRAGSLALVICLIGLLALFLPERFILRKLHRE